MPNRLSANLKRSSRSPDVRVLWKWFIDNWIANVARRASAIGLLTNQRFAGSGIVPLVRLILIGTAVAPTRGRVD